MSILLQESPDSREMHFGGSGSGQTLLYTAVVAPDGATVPSEVDVYNAVIAQSPATFNGFLRQDVKVTPKGGPLFAVEVTYGTTGVNGGDKPLTGTLGSNTGGGSGGGGGGGSGGGGANGGSGGPPSDTTGPSSGEDALKGGYSFAVSPPKLHITQSRLTMSRTKRGGGVARNFKGAIGVDKDLKIEGCDTPPDPSFTWKRTVSCAVITQKYLNTLALVAGKPNDASFYGWDIGEVLFMGADGQYAEGQGWSVTYTFGVEKNETNITICDGLVVPAKKGFEYLWVLYEDIIDGGFSVTVPAAAYVEQVLPYASFGLLGIGE